jgi:hypothetical protein
MKKFLTVLLALSVVFTYTVGTAFATSTLEQRNTAAGAAVTSAMKLINTYANNLIAQEEIAGTYESAVITEAANEVVELGREFVNTYAYETGSGMPMGNSDDADYDADVLLNAVKAWLSNSNVSGTMGTDKYAYTGETFDAKFAEIAKVKDIAAKKKNAITALEAVDTSKYYVAYDANGNKTTDNVTTAANLIKTAKTTIKAVSEAADAYDASVETIRATLYGTKTVETYTKESSSFGTNDLETVTTKYNAKTDVADLPQADSSTTTYQAADGSTLENEAATSDGDKKIVTGIVAGVYGKLEALETTAAHEKAVAANKERANVEMAKITAYVNTTYYPDHKVSAGDSVASDWLYVDATSTAKATVAGVEVANASKITEAEATAINAALRAKLDTVLEVFSVYYSETEWSASVAAASTYFDTGTPATFESYADKALAAVAKYEALQESAAALKTQLDTNGNKMYNDADVDEALAKAKITVYTTFVDYAEKDDEKNWSKVTLAPTAISDPVEEAITNASLLQRLQIRNTLKHIMM